MSLRTGEYPRCDNCGEINYFFKRFGAAQLCIECTIKENERFFDKHKYYPE